MKCSQIRKMISPYVDDELDPAEERMFTAHVQGCLACRKELEETQEVHRLFTCAERFEAPLGFAARVMAQVEEAEGVGLFSRLWGLLTARPLFLRTVEVAFALVIMVVGMISGNMLVADRTSGTATSGVHAGVEETFSLDLFQAAPPGSIGGVYASLTGAANER